MSLDAYLKSRSDRCGSCGYHPPTQGHGADCRGSDEWTFFVTALRNAVGPDGLIHQGNVRPIIRGRVEPKHVGTFYRRAKSEGLIRDTGEREPSNDVQGRNADKLDRVYEWRAAA